MSDKWHYSLNCCVWNHAMSNAIICVPWLLIFIESSFFIVLQLGKWFSHTCFPPPPSSSSALFVVDLKKFRKIAAGDRLRGQYQALSQDPNSLSNLDQVLYNITTLDEARASSSPGTCYTLMKVFCLLLLICFDLILAYLTSHVFRTFPTTWSTRWPSSLFHRSGCGARPGAMMLLKPKLRR